MKNVVIVLLAIVAVGSLCANALLYQRYSTQRPLMRIGSETISIKDYRDLLDYEYGKPVLNKMAYRMLVLQKAKEAGVLPADQDVQQRLADIRRRTPKVLEEATNNPTKMQELERGLIADIALENLTIKDIQVSDAELKDFYTKNKGLFGVPAQARTTVVVARNAVDASTATALLKDKTVGIGVIANQPRLAVVGINGFQPDWTSVSTSVQQKIARAIFDAPVGGVATIRGGETFFVIRVDAVADSGIEPFAKVRHMVERAAKLKKAPAQQVVLARLYKDTNISFEVDKYAQYFEDMETFARTRIGTDKSSVMENRVVALK